MIEEIINYISGEFSIITAIISAAVSLLVAYLTARVMIKIKIKDIQHSFVVSLYEKRYDTYTKLLEITQDVGMASNMTKELHKDTLEKLKEWQKKSGGFLLLSKKALKRFNKLRKVLNKNPRDGEKGYSDVQRKNIYRARNEFRKALRNDFDFFHKAENSLRYGLYSFFERMWRGPRS